MSRRVLFCWEIGEGSGHVGPYLSLLSALAERGWEVALALRNTAVAGEDIRSRWPVFQAPVCLNEFTGISGSPANHTELYLGFGFAHAPTLASLAGGWRALFDAWRPDLVLANNAPVALLAAKACRVPVLRIGTGFECPPGGARPPLLQPWQAGLEPRLDRAESLALRNANAVLREGGAPQTASLADIVYNVPALLATVQEFDEFPNREGRCEYLGPLPDAGGGIQPRRPVEIFAYLRVQHARTADAVDAIGRTRRPALVCLPDASEAQCLAHSTEFLEVRREPADLMATLPGVKAVVCYASHSVTLAALMAGKPLLLLPDHPEQRRTAERVAELGAGIVVTKEDRPARVAAGLKRVLDEAALQEAARRFEARQTPDDGYRALARAVAACESAAVPLPVQLKVIRS